MKKRKSFLIGLCLLVSVVCFFTLPVSAEISFKQAGPILKSFVIDTGTGKITIKRREWSNTYIATESGKGMGLIDPFMYNVGVAKADGTKANGYWNKPEIFDLWGVEEVKDPKRQDASIVKITADVPNFGLCKEVTIAVEANENIAYVFNRITSTEDITLKHDTQMIYFYKPEQDYTIWVDGQELVPKGGLNVPINQYLLLQHKKTGVSVAVVFLERAVQSYPHSNKAPFGRVTFYINDKTDGAACSWNKGGGKMAKGDTRVQQYILVWGDGDLRERIEALSKKALTGKLNDKVYVLSKNSADSK